MKKFVLALSLLCLLAMSVTAGPLIIASNATGVGAGHQYNTGVQDGPPDATGFSDGIGGVGYGGTKFDNVVLTPAHNSWAAEMGDSEWISFINDYTPTPDSQSACTIGVTSLAAASNPSSASLPAGRTASICNGDSVTFYHEFTLSGASTGFLEVLADDTANVWLNGKLLFAANTSTSAGDYPKCSEQVVGCSTFNPDTKGERSLGVSDFLLGNNVLVFQVLQRNGTGFGLDYKLTIVPEPGFYGALALGLSGLYLAVRRRRQNS